MAFQHCDTTRLSEDIDRGLDNFGSGVKEIVYFRMKQEIEMDRSDIVNKPEVFETFLDEMFGQGARTIEKTILKIIEDDFGIQHPLSLSDAIKQARSRIYENATTV
jgi:hypothetical protein